ncbi:MAG: HAD family hydrolase [Spirochaetaceae bacterium]|nr:MAG: HAD family hydrolase [Spirochaetaceae bacterium]
MVRETIIEAVLFDFDSTLTRPGSIDFGAIKESIGCPSDSMILDFIATLEEATARQQATEVLIHNERIAADASLPADGAEDLVKSLRRHGYRVGILTRNTRDSIERSLRNFEQLSEQDFDTIVSRDDPIAVKPDPDSVRYAARRLRVLPQCLLMVGDHYHDIAAGRGAGSWTCLIAHETRPSWADEVGADYELDALDNLWRILAQHRPLQNGKLPGALLEELLNGLGSVAQRPDVIVSAAVGRDFAAVDPGARKTVVAKSDPITFVTEMPGRHLVTVNANDLICSGALPRWFLCTALFPPKTTFRCVRDLLLQVDRACTDIGAALIGGHTEVTDAVTRPILAGTMLGTSSRPALRDYGRPSEPAATASSGVTKYPTAGDRLLMTKSAAIEGTLILASTARETLLQHRVTSDDISEVLGWHGKLSIVPEAKLALELPHVRMLHDVTEGGVATAVRELAAAARVRLRVNVQDIPVAPQTRAICGAVGCDPLGLIGSGSLLLLVDAEVVPALLQSLHAAGIAACDIGLVIGDGTGEILGDLPLFEVDELARLQPSNAEP